jgi:hypothetical protein
MMEKEWLKEPNEVKFEHAGFKCLILRNDRLKHLNGYVALPKGHPYYGKGYTDIDVSVHGGITFANKGDSKRWERGYWWVGFDTGHSADFSPGMAEIAPGLYKGGHPRGEYRNIHYVIQETKDLAEQLKVVNIAIRKLLNGDKREF